ncbi:MAG: hypothetical protein IPM82_21350 [Saprospiraceae bacterium]|nr:hypothetical protein [Saprospiraceae bacterium]
MNCTTPPFWIRWPIPIGWESVQQCAHPALRPECNGRQRGRQFLYFRRIPEPGRRLPGPGFQKYSLRFNGEAGGKRFKIGNNLSFSATDRKVINFSGDGFGGGNELNAIRYALIAAPVAGLQRRWLLRKSHLRTRRPNPIRRRQRQPAGA